MLLSGKFSATSFKGNYLKGDQSITNRYVMNILEKFNKFFKLQCKYSNKQEVYSSFNQLFQNK